ncbi:MAG TPA: hypothetical protein VKY22_17855 [Bradyrhizobium sp.]|nr:hypothetical protein [Bradyrhizobium sp.]
MTIEAMEVMEAGVTQDIAADESWTLQWTPIVAGALVACAASSIMITFGAALGLGVSSAAPTWRDTSIALALLSGLYLILQALISFGCGGYLAGRCRAPYGEVDSDVVEKRDGMHGVTSWALAVILGTGLAALIAFGATGRPSSLTQPATTSEPSVISSEIDHLFRAERQPPSIDQAPLRTQAGRILMMSSSHSGISTDDRAYLVRLVTATTGLTGPDAEHRVDAAIADSRTAIAHARASTVVLAFSIAAALLFGAVAAWAGAEAGGRHRDGAPLSSWMLHANSVGRKRGSWQCSLSRGA